MPARPTMPHPSDAAPATIAGYPARRIRWDEGGTAVEVFVVDDLEALVDRDALLRDADAPEPPYWAHLWTGSRALARHLVRQGRAGGRALDIGCGVGLAGLVAARLGAATTFVDHAAAALPFARASARANGMAGHFVQADLRAIGIDGRFDLCLAADVTYDPELQHALARLIAEQLAPAGVAWCAESVRTTDDGFPAACRELGLATAVTVVADCDEGRTVSVRLVEVRRDAAALTLPAGSAQANARRNSSA